MKRRAHATLKIDSVMMPTEKILMLNDPEIQSTELQLIDQIINMWLWSKFESSYFKRLIPDVIAGKTDSLDSAESRIFNRLKSLLSDNDWQNLAVYIKIRLSGNNKEAANWQEFKEGIIRQQNKRERDIIQQELANARWQKDRELLLEQGEKDRIRLDQQQEQKRRDQMLLAQKEKEAKERLLEQIDAQLETDYLAIDLFFANHPDAAIIDKASFLKLKANFVQKWIQNHISNFSVDDEQAQAISAMDGDIQVIARAGSGKTRTLVARAIFLQNHCRVSPNELLLLAFNNKAVDEIQERIETITGKSPHVMTFHALAYAIVQPEEDLIYDDNSTSQLKQSREIQEVIDDHVCSIEHHNHIRDVMLKHFREDWDAIIEGNNHFNLEERRALPQESLNGDYVKSFGEKTIANILFENSVDYKYERNYRWNSINYRPDFTIFSGKNEGIIIEYFGLKGEHAYDEMTEQKRAFWRLKPEWKLLEYFPSDIAHYGVDAFTHRLICDLNNLGIQTRKRTDDEVWNLIRQRSIDRFTKAIRSFVGRCRILNLSPAQLEEKVQTFMVFSEAETKFLITAVSVYKGYLQKLKAHSQEDFDGLMWRAIEMLNKGQYRFARDKGKELGDIKNIRYVLIDEFQDFSEMFFQLSMAIRKVNDAAQFFCVGDDWQAINEFAGSELRFFRDFSKYFFNTSKYYISSNYRSAASIVQFGNALMHGFGNPAIAAKSTVGESILCHLDELNLTRIEQSIHNGDEFTPALLRLINFYISRGERITLLVRRNWIPWYVNYSDSLRNISDVLQKLREHLASFFPEKERALIQISSTHKYKGNQNPVVIILDAVERSFPFIHPNWIFLRIFGESVPNVEAAERRLFYVALTRPEETLLVVTEKGQESPYLNEIELYAKFTRIDWRKFPPPPSLSTGGDRVEVQVLNSYNIKDKLKKLGYSWNRSGKHWVRTFQKDGFVFAEFVQQEWVNKKVEIKVFSEAMELIYRSGPNDR